MKLSSLLTLTLLSISCLGAKKNSGGTFENYLAKSLSSAPLRLDDASYDELTTNPRNHSLVVLLTALEARFGCQLCREFQPEWNLLGKSWAKGDRHGDSRILLGTLDFADGKGTFQKVLVNESGVNAINGWLRLTALPSLCYKLLPSFFYSRQLRVQTQNLTDSPFDMISPPGKFVWKTSMHSLADFHGLEVLSPPSKWLVGLVVICQTVPSPPYSDP